MAQGRLGGSGEGAPSAPRSVALVGPQGSGKSTLFEALLGAAAAAAAGEGAPARRGGGAGAARGASAGTELRLGHCEMAGDPWAVLDCPGSVEFAHDAACALAVADLAVVVCEPAPERAAALGPLFRRLEEAGLPALVFVNKLDAAAPAAGAVRETLAALQAQTRRKLLLRQVPIREAAADGDGGGGGNGGGDGGGEARVVGYVDLVSGRAYRYRRGAPSERIAPPAAVRAREAEARGALLEALADHDDGLLEKVLEDLAPEPAEIYRPLRESEASGAVAGVLLGAAEHGHGVQRLWKALRHDAPAAARTAARRGVAPDGPPLVQVFRTVHAGHAGRLSFARVWRGPLRDGQALDGHRAGGLTRFPGGEAQKAAQAEAGDLVAIGRLEGVATGQVLGGGGPEAAALSFPAPPPPVHALAIAAEDRKDEVRLSVALARLAEEDPALVVGPDPESGATVLAGQGEMHLRAALERLAAGGARLRTSRAPVAFRETVRGAVVQHARLKRQTGGHGQFADVKLRIAPRPRGAGFRFDEEVVGGAVPRRFIPAVGHAAEEATRKGPLGHPVVDVAVTLLDGGFHSVDSSDMAFAAATRMAMAEGLAKAGPVLLEPVDEVTVSVPAGHTPSAQRLLAGRRGQILGFAAKPGWEGWDEVQALVPAAELADLIIELRSQTQGLGTYTRRFDHLAEARGR